CRIVQRRPCDAHRPPARTGCAGAHLRPAGSAPADRRSHGDRRAGGRRLAAGGPRRCVAQPADADQARPRLAGAAHRVVGARLRPGDGCQGGHSGARRQARRCADGGVALRAKACRGGRRAALVARGDQYIEWARALDAPQARPQPVARPEPKPPVAARPATLSVTEIEQWLRDPYSIYAKHVLGLRPLDPVDTPPGARDRGVVVHGAIGDFTKAFQNGLPDDVLAELIRLGERHFARLDDTPDAKAFWWPRFCRIARWFTEFETVRRRAITHLSAEIGANLKIEVPGGTFTLTARADRIERRTDGRYAILDYKTGNVPTPNQVRSGLAPQLTLEGAMLRRGAFEGIPAGSSIAEFMYVALRGGQPPGEPKVINWDDSSPDDESDTAINKLISLVAKFYEQETPYRSLERPMFLRRNAGDYDHLSRVKEWSLSGGAADPEAGSGE